MLHTLIEDIRALIKGLEDIPENVLAKIDDVLDIKKAATPDIPEPAVTDAPAVESAPAAATPETPAAPTTDAPQA